MYGILISSVEIADPAIGSQGFPGFASFHCPGAFPQINLYSKYIDIDISYINNTNLSPSLVVIQILSKYRKYKMAQTNQPVFHLWVDTKGTPKK
jgi:hypothetical protein